ncbi:hypothetical protein E9529_00725 [Blastococcus sp. KM273128]|uniref:hypothetical protein n=1 Tax=Blastococcus sp. KM273128 TaxID=2570314 RepID=UPI001F35BA04|nr:hypothetical protein [Blastococcus sp. KM273128]MCF6742815.1 hypothetical protein [Blastococcus sp. KM273128]
MQRPQSPAAWVVLAAFPVVLAACVLLVISAVSDGNPVLGLFLLAVGSLMSAAALFRLQTRNEARRPRR